MKQFFIVTLVLLVSLLGALCARQNFRDVPKGHWAYNDVLNLKNEGILVGYPDGEFKGK